MTSSEPTPGAAGTSDLDTEVDEAIKACDGDPRATIRALIVTMRHLEEQVRRLATDVSRGYSRGVYDGLRHPLLYWPHGKPDGT